ncbi:MAG: oligosaccharide flippase family protein [Bacillota bacterium]
MRRDSFLRGAFILLIGSLVSRLLGAVYRFVLPWLMGGGDQGAYGMALFGMPYSIYSIALVLSTMGIPLAISKLVSEASAVGSVRQVRRVFFVSLGLLAAMGAVVTVGLYYLSPFLANQVWKNPDAYYSMVALAPAVFFVAVMSAFRGLFQGLQTMTPHAVSQIVEQIFRVITMFVLVIVLIPHGLKYAAAGATFGATGGAFVGVLYLGWVYMRHRRELWRREVGDALEGRTGIGDMIREILVFAVPISISGIIMPLMRFVDAAVVPSRLMATGYSVVSATTAYGYLESYSMPLVNVPAVFTAAIAISLVPSISSSLARGDREGIREKALASLRLAALIGVPSAMGLFILSTEIPAFFWRCPEAGPVLAAVSGVAVFLTIQQVTSAALQGMGHPVLPMRNLMVGAVVKFILTWILAAVPVLGAAGAGLATVAGFLLAASLNLLSLMNRVGPFSITALLWRAAAASAVMGAVVRFASDALRVRLGLPAAVGGSVFLGIVVYGVLMLLLGGIRSSDLEMIPRVGSRIADQLRALRLLRR